MKAVLIYIRPLDTKANARVDIRVADGPSADAFRTGAIAWEPAIKRRPSLSIELFSKDLDGKVQAGRATFELSLRNVLSHPDPARLYWRGAPVIIQADGPLEGPNAVPEFNGNVTDAKYDRDTRTLTVTAEVSAVFIDKPLLTLSFGGGGGADGDPNKRGVWRPFGAGAVKNIEPVWFDLVRNIGQIDGYGSTQSIDWLGEGRSSYGPKQGDYPSYAALAAAIDNKTIKPGQWGTCIAEGLVGLGAPATGKITVDAVFAYNRLGALMRRIISAHAGVPDVRIDTAAFTQLDADVNRPVHYWTGEQRNVKDLLQALARSACATPLVTFQSSITVTRAVRTNPALTLDLTGGGFPRITTTQVNTPDAPFYQIAARAARPALVLSLDQVLYVDTLEDVGVYNAATVYRAGNLVWLRDGSQWLYQNDTPGAGHDIPVDAKPDANGDVQDAYWFRRQPPKRASDFTYDDGTTLEALKPAAPGATNSKDPDSPFGDDGETVGEQKGKTNTALDALGAIVGATSPSEIALRARAFVAGLQKQRLTQLADQLRQQGDRLRFDALTHTDGIPHGPTITRIDIERETGDEILAQTITLVAARLTTAAEELEAYVLRVDEARITSEEVTATALLLLRAARDDTQTQLDAQVMQIFNARVDDLSAQASAFLDVTAAYSASIDAAVTSLTNAYSSADMAIASTLTETTARLTDNILAQTSQFTVALADATQSQAQIVAGVRADFATALQGQQALFTAETGRIDNALSTATSSLAEQINFVAATLMAADASNRAISAAEVTQLFQAIVDEQSARAQAVFGVQSSFDGQQSSVELLLRSVNGKEALAKLTVNSAGQITGFTVNGVDRSFKVQASTFEIEGKKPFLYDSDKGVLYLPSIVVDTLTANSVNFDQLTFGAAQRLFIWQTQGDVTIARAATKEVVWITFTKYDADSYVDISFNADIFSQDDFQFTINFQVDGVTKKSNKPNMVFVGDNAALTFAPFALLKDVAVGDRRIGVSITNNEADNANLIVYGGALLKVIEVRKGSLGSGTGGDASGGSGTSGSGGTGGGGYSGGGGGGGGLNTPRVVQQ